MTQCSRSMFVLIVQESQVLRSYWLAIHPILQHYLYPHGIPKLWLLVMTQWQFGKCIPSVSRYAVCLSCFSLSHTESECTDKESFRLPLKPKWLKPVNSPSAYLVLWHCLYTTLTGLNFSFPAWLLSMKTKVESNTLRHAVQMHQGLLTWWKLS